MFANFPGSIEDSYRHPALLAKMASTVDVLSHGRLNVGIGAGWNAQEYRVNKATVRAREQGTI